MLVIRVIGRDGQEMFPVGHPVEIADGPISLGDLLDRFTRDSRRSRSAPAARESITRSSSPLVLFFFLRVGARLRRRERDAGFRRATI